MKSKLRLTPGKAAVAIYATALISISALTLSLNSKMKVMRDELEEVKKYAYTLEDEIPELEKEVESLNKKIEELEKENKDKEKELKDSIKKNNDLKEENKKLKKTNNIQTASRGTSYAKNTSGYTTFKATAYSTYANGDPYAGKKWGDKTATGTRVKQGRTIAVDPKRIKLGSKVDIIFPEPYSHLNGVYIAEDTGGAIKGNKVDIYLNNYQECLRFGRRDIKLKVIS